MNEQAHVGLLLAGPGVIATLAFAPLVMDLLYSPAFRDAVDILRWLCLGTMLQVISFPLGFVIVAQSRQGIFFGAELAYTVVYLALAWVLVGLLGPSRRRDRVLRVLRLPRPDGVRHRPPAHAVPLVCRPTAARGRSSSG